MPSNGAVSNGYHATKSTENGDVLDCARALEYLESGYVDGDGLDVQTMMDSKANGGLTYNDFLVLPGYIGTYGLFYVLDSFSKRIRISCQRGHP